MGSRNHSFLLAIACGVLTACAPSGDAAGGASRNELQPWPAGDYSAASARCEALYRVDDSGEPDSFVIEIERGGWRLREVGQAERYVSEPAQLLAALRECSDRHAWGPSAHQDEVASPLFSDREVSPSGNRWDGRSSSLRAAVHAPSEAPVGEVLCVLNMLGSERVRARRHSWWMIEEDGALRQVGMSLTPWLASESSPSHAGPIDDVEVVVSLVDTGEPTNSEPRTGTPLSYSLGPRVTSDLDHFASMLRETLRKLDDSPERLVSLQLPAEARSGDISPLLQLVVDEGALKIELDSQLSAPVAALLQPEGERWHSWWWPQIHTARDYPRAAWEQE